MPRQWSPPAPSEESADPAAASSTTGLNLEEGIVQRVVDGDTAYVLLSSGVEEKVRFIGVDTPESTMEHEPYGEEASDYTKSRLDGRTVYLETDVELRDRYGRLLAYVWLEPPTDTSESELREKLFCAHLLLEGYGQVLTIPPNVKYADAFLTFQQEARTGNRGLWGLETQEAPAEAPSEQQGTFVGSVNSDKYHYASCRWAGEIYPENEIWFSSTDDAHAHGYVPCKVCTPP
jgi:micrococcal nuclease